MKSWTFETSNGYKLVIKNRKSAVIFEIEGEKVNKQLNFWLAFNPKDFEVLTIYIEDIAIESWDNLNPKEADSFGADYHEYYDRKLDNNGYLSIRQNGLLIERPSSDSKKLYQFNKKKMESFIYDLRKLPYFSRA